MTDTPPAELSFVELMRLFGITEVVLIDDGDRNDAIDAEAAAGRVEDGTVELATLLATPGVAEILDERGIPTADEPAVRSVVAEHIRNDGLIVEEPDNLDGLPHAIVTDRLIALCESGGVTFTSLDFDQWVAPPAPEPSVLYLFDYRQKDEEVGARLALDLATAADGEAYIGVLSRETGEAFALWRDNLAAIGGDAAMRVVWLSKSLLGDGGAQFTESLAVALAAPALDTLRSRALSALHQAVEDKSTSLGALTPYELFRLTIGVPAADGALEADSLIDFVARQALPHAAASVQRDAEVRTATVRLRGLQPAKPSDTSSDELIRMQATDYYVGRDQMVGCHRPLSAGDLVAVVEPGLVLRSHLAGEELDELTTALESSDLRILVVVGQACDLAMRKGGKRDPSIESIEAIEVIVPNDKDKRALEVGATELNRQRLFRLPWMNVGTREHRQAVYKSARRVPALALDACVWSPLDLAAVTIGETPPEYVARNWLDHHGACGDEFQDIRSYWKLAAELTEKDENSPIAAGLRRKAAPADDLVKFEYDDEAGVCAWGLLRIGQLREPYCSGLVQDYYDYRQRAAYPGPLLA